LITSATEAQGPEVGIAVLRDIIDDEAYDIRTTGHDMAHIVGRTTAKHFGIGSEYFLRCPTDFFYACQHGFFEQALLEISDLAEAAQTICGGLLHPSKRMEFFCYHGAGHGFMMSRGNDVAVALEACDELPTLTSRRGCAQGVFMENLNAYGQGKALPQYFNRDPLSPCNDVEPRHQWACYVNHGSYLLTTFNSWEAMIGACKKAAQNMIGTCIFSVGQLLSDPLWNQNIPTKSPLVANNAEAWVKDLCLLVEEQYQPHCIAGAAEHWINHLFDEEAIGFCSILPAPLPAGCFRHVGFSLKDRQTTQRSDCEIVPAQYRNFCREGQEPEYASVNDLPSRDAIDWETVQSTKSTPGVLGRFLSFLQRSIERFTGMFQQVSPQNIHRIRYDAQGFHPPSVDVKAGDTVIWENASNDVLWPASDPHPVHNAYPGFDPQRPLQSGETWSYVFQKRSQWGYHNHWHPAHTGAIIVR
jgi:plastocyanin